MKRLILFVIFLATPVMAQSIQGVAIDTLPMTTIKWNHSEKLLDTNCYIVCEKLDTLGFEKIVETREIECPDHYPGCCVLHWGTFVVWKPTTVVKELVRIKIPCDKARLVDPKYLKVEIPR